MKIAICGGGHLGHVVAGFLAAQPETEVRMLTRKNHKAGMTYDRNPQFYCDWDIESSETLIAMDNEFQQLLTLLLVRNTADNDTLVAALKRLSLQYVTIINTEHNDYQNENHYRRTNQSFEHFT